MAVSATALKTKAAPKPKQWVWEARTRAGEVKKGEMEALDASAVDTRLKALGLSPLKVKKKAMGITFPTIGSGVTGKDILVFTKQFATMIDAGLPLVQCLDILANQMDNAAFKKVVLAIKAKVESGATFADALKDHPKVFDELFIQLCAAGEVGGILDTILNRLAIYIEKAMKLRRQVRGAMVYPTAVIIVFVGVLCVLLGFVIPSFETMFKDFGSTDELPVLTQMVIAVSQGFMGNLPWVLLGLVAVVGALVYTYRRRQGKKFFHKLFLRLPILGPVLRKIAVARFTRTLGRCSPPACRSSTRSTSSPRRPAT